MRGSKPGERRGGRKKGSLNGATVRRAAETVELVKITVERVLQEYGRIAFLDISQAFDAEGNLKSIHDMPEDIRRAIAGIEVSEITSGDEVIGKLKKIKILDKRAALADIGKHLGMFIDRIAGPDGKTPVQPPQIIVQYFDKPSPSAADNPVS